MIGVGEERASSTFVVWGDSHAQAVSDVLHGLAKEQGVRGAFFATGGCVPIRDVSLSPPQEGCQKMKDAAWAYVQTYDIQNILLISRWSKYVQSKSKTLIIDDSLHKVSLEGSRAVFVKRGTEMIRALLQENRKVYILKQVPEHEHFNRRAMFYAMRFEQRQPTYEPSTLSEYVDRHGFPNRTFDLLADTLDGLTLIDPRDVFCTLEQGCLLEKNGVLLYMDTDHVNNAGAILLRPLFEGLMQSSRQK